MDVGSQKIEIEKAIRKIKIVKACELEDITTA